MTRFITAALLLVTLPVADGAGKNRVRRSFSNWTVQDSLNARPAEIAHALSGACNCPMCCGIRSVHGSRSGVTSQQLNQPIVQAWQNDQPRVVQSPIVVQSSRPISVVKPAVQIGQPILKSVKKQTNPEAATPLEVRLKMLAMMDLKGPKSGEPFDYLVHDVHCDLGSGKEAGVCRSAAKMWNVKSIGVEIDYEDVLASRKLVDEDIKKGLLRPGQVTIIHADALEFDLRANNVTCVTAYLDPEMILLLAEKLREVDRFALPYHPFPGELNGLTESAEGNVYYYTIRAIAARSVNLGKFKFVPLGQKRDSVVQKATKPVQAASQKGTMSPPYLTKYTASWCGPCKSWDTNELVKVQRGGVAVGFVDIDKPENQQYVQQQGITPPYFELSVGGKTVKRWQGYVSAETILKAVE